VHMLVQHGLVSMEVRHSSGSFRRFFKVEHHHLHSRSQSPPQSNKATTLKRRGGRPSLFLRIRTWIRKFLSHILHGKEDRNDDHITTITTFPF